MSGVARNEGSRNSEKGKAERKCHNRRKKLTCVWGRSPGAAQKVGTGEKLGGRGGGKV